jgi:oligosaccharyltransferase complex subunit epsilon
MSISSFSSFFQFPLVQPLFLLISYTSSSLDLLYPKLDADDRFGSTVGQFCLLAGLRAQISPGREGEFKEVSQER